MSWRAEQTPLPLWRRVLRCLVSMPLGLALALVVFVAALRVSEEHLGRLGRLGRPTGPQRSRA